MFDTLAKSVLSYGCEMQGISDALQHINLLSVCTIDLYVSHVPLAKVDIHCVQVGGHVCT